MAKPLLLSFVFCISLSIIIDKIYASTTTTANTTLSTTASTTGSTTASTTSSATDSTTGSTTASTISSATDSTTTNTTALSFDPCTDYKDLDDPERSTAYARETTAICDSTITEQWYRSVSGAGPDMPTSPVPTGRCGTQYPIWIDDTLPTHYVGKEVKACIAHFIFGNCYRSFNIKVKNCSDFNVYYLLQTSVCPVAYCFGTYLRCPVHQTSTNGFYPGCHNYTVFIGNINCLISIKFSTGCRGDACETIHMYLEYLEKEYTEGPQKHIAKIVTLRHMNAVQQKPGYMNHCNPRTCNKHTLQMKRDHKFGHTTGLQLQRPRYCTSRKCKQAYAYSDLYCKDTLWRYTFV